MDACLETWDCVLLVITPVASGETNRIYHIAYSGGIITLEAYTNFCMFIHHSVICQSLGLDKQRTSLDNDDALLSLLYISLVASILWAGFHLYSLVLSEI
jgi:hypothetical protein